MLIFVIFCQGIFVNIFNNVPFHFALLLKQDVFCDLDDIFEVFVDIDNDISMLKDAYLALVA